MNALFLMPLAAAPAPYERRVAALIRVAEAGARPPDEVLAPATAGGG